MLALGAAFALGACATLAPEVGPVPPAQPFDLSGRVLVRFDGRAFSSGLRWRHALERDEIWLLTPIGQALAYIVNTPDEAILTHADQTQYRAASAESLTRQALGWELPLRRLQYWVRGEIARDSAPREVVRDGDGRLLRLDQDGWIIEFDNHPPDEHEGLPRRLDLKRGSHRIVLVVDGWRRGGESP